MVTGTASGNVKAINIVGYLVCIKIVQQFFSSQVQIP
jgi:hypothetical protein